MSRAAIFRQRLPFAGLLLAAMAGILVAAAWNPGAGFLCGIAAAALGAWFFLRRTWLVLIAVAAAFGAAHTWQTVDSPGAALARELGDSRVLADISGRVVDAPAPYGASRHRFTIATRSVSWDGSTRAVHTRIHVVAPGDPPARGDLIRASGSLTALGPARNPSGFDSREWLGLRGIACELVISSPGDLEVVRRASGFSLPAIADRCRGWTEATLRSGISDAPVISDLLAGMVLGITRSIPDSLREQFRHTGTFHLFSVSGLHVGMIGVILWQVLRIAGAGRRTAVAIIIPTLFFYALMTGWKPPSVRAATMAAVFLTGMVASRQPVPVNSLCAAGFFLLAYRTNELFNPGFQLSFLVVFTILVVAGPVRRALLGLTTPDPFLPRQLWTPLEKCRAIAGDSAGGLAAVSFAAWLGSLPLMIVYFHMIPLSALVANLIAVPLAFVIMSTAMLALAGGLVSALLASIFNNANWLFTSILILVIQSMASIPGAYIRTGTPERDHVKVTVFDFGAGGASAVEAGGRILLYDSGPAYETGSVIRPWLSRRGREAPDLLIVSHGDARHIGGAADLIAGRAGVQLIDAPVDDRSPTRRRLIATAEESGIPVSRPAAGEKIDWAEGVSLRVLHPPAGLIKREADDKVMVVRLDYGAVSVLFLSDAGLATQDWLRAKAGSALQADVLVAGRHRSGIPVDRAFIEAVKPALVITTVSTFPENEPLDETWAAMVRSLGIRLFTQDRTGAVEIGIRPELFSARGFVDGREFSATAGFRPARYEQSHR